MSIREPRCMVCGAPLDQGAIFNKDPRISETCSYECAGWCESVHLFDKKECDQSRICGPNAREMFEYMPNKCVIIRG